jgi:hypothetical protein
MLGKEFHVICINNKGKELYLTEGRIYTVIINYFIGSNEFYILKEIKNISFESFRFKSNPKPGYATPVIQNDNLEEEKKVA